MVEAAVGEVKAGRVSKILDETFFDAVKREIATRIEIVLPWINSFSSGPIHLTL